MRLGAVDPYGDLSTGGTKLLEESAVSPDPQVLLCDLHLRRGKRNQVHTVTRSLTYSDTQIPCLEVLLFLLTAHRYPEPGVVSRPRRSLVIAII